MVASSTPLASSRYAQHLLPTIPLVELSLMSSVAFTPSVKHMPSSRLRAFCALGLPVVLGCCGRYVASKVATADSLYRERQYPEAISAYDKASRFDPNNPHIVRQLGFAHDALGHRALAYSFLQKAQELQPDSVDVRLALGALYLRDVQDTNAISEANAVLKKHPDNAEALNLRGGADLDRDPGAAMSDFRRLAEVVPQNPRPPYMIGSILLAQGDTAGATREFEQSLALGPAAADPLQKLVSIELARKRPDAALDRVKKQIAVAGDSASLHTLLGSVYVARGDLSSARGEFRKAIAVDQKYAEAYAELAGTYQSAGNLDTAIAIASQAIRVDSMNLGARMVLGVSYQARGDAAKAEGQYEAALAVNPRYASAANNLAWMISERNVEPGRALSLAQLAKALDPNNPEISDTYGWILYKQGQYGKAVAQLKESAVKLPGDGSVAFHLGMATLAAGDTAAAKAAFQRAADSKQNIPEKAQAQRALSGLK